MLKPNLISYWIVLSPENQRRVVILRHLQAAEYQHLLNRLVDREELVFKNFDGVDLDLEEIMYLAKNVWRVKSARADANKLAGEKGLTRYLGDLQFTRQFSCPEVWTFICYISICMMYPEKFFSRIPSLSSAHNIFYILTKSI